MIETIADAGVVRVLADVLTLLVAVLVYRVMGNSTEARNAAVQAAVNTLETDHTVKNGINVKLDTIVQTVESLDERLSVLEADRNRNGR